VIWNPWRRARELQVQLDRAKRENEHLERALRDSADRYDRIRDANAKLRDTLTLYREASRG
jgi:septal ring factor EnvC (AmiA/AmiB activator)